MIIKVLYVAAAVACKLSPRRPTKQRALILILSVAPEFLEPIRSHFGVSNGMHDILWPMKCCSARLRHSVGNKLAQDFGGMKRTTTTSLGARAALLRWFTIA
jgi:hypothetical protein